MFGYLFEAHFAIRENRLYDSPKRVFLVIWQPGKKTKTEKPEQSYLSMIAAGHSFILWQVTVLFYGKSSGAHAICYAILCDAAVVLEAGSTRRRLNQFQA